MFGGFKRYRACINAMNAKNTWQQLSEQEKNNVDIQARIIFVNDGNPSTIGDDIISAVETRNTFKSFNEFELYSIYSTAMIEGYIMPVTPEPWDPPRNPFILQIKQSDIEKASRYFATQYGINISLNI